MKTLTDFLPEVMPSVPGCPQPMVINAIRNSVIEFQERSGLSEQTIPITLVPDLADYMLTPAAGTTLRELLRGDLDSQPVYPATEADLDSDNAAWRFAIGTPTRMLVKNGLLKVTPIPQLAGTLNTVFVDTLTRTATDVDDVLIDEWMETIASGALRRLLAMPGVAWSNPDLSMYHKGVFDTDVCNARIERDKAGTNASIRIQPRRFG